MGGDLMDWMDGHLLLGRASSVATVLPAHAADSYTEPLPATTIQLSSTQLNPT